MTDTKNLIFSWLTNASNLRAQIIRNWRTPFPPEERELIIRQARRIYNDRNMHPDNPRMVMQERTGVPVKEEYQVTPQKQGYPDDTAEREYAAEAFTAYMSNANGTKTDAPDLAKMLRQIVRETPELKGILRLNGVGGLGVTGIAAGSNGLAGYDAKGSRTGESWP